jgi:hypothetical protein
MQEISLRGWAWAIPAYALLHFLHVVLWRIRRPQKDVVCLFELLIGFPTLLCAVLALWGISPLRMLPALVFEWILAANYIAVYPAVQASSPTLDMLSQLRKNPTGLTETELSQHAGPTSLFQDRLSDLVQGGLVKRSESGFELTWKGNGLATFFVVYRRFLGLPRGAG